MAEWMVAFTEEKILEQKKTFFPLLLPSKYVVCMSIYNVYSKSQKKNLSQKLSFLSIKIIQAIWKFVKLGTAWEIFICTLEYQINLGLRLLNFELFSQAYALIRYPTFINFPMHAGTRLRT